MEELRLSISVGLNDEPAVYRTPRNHAGTCPKSKHQRVLKSAILRQGSIVTLGPLRVFQTQKSSKFPAWNSSKMYGDMKMGSFYNGFMLDLRLGTSLSISP